MVNTQSFEWEAFGDVNPFDHGGLWIREDRECGNGYDVVCVVPLEEATGEPGYLVESAYVDIEDDWVDWDRVREFINYCDHEHVELLIEGAIRYYGVENFSGTSIEIATREEAKKEIQSYGIELQEEE